MIVIAILVAASKLIFWHDIEVMKGMIDSLSSSAKTGFELSLYLTGAMCLWLGIMRIGENGGAMRKMTQVVTPAFFSSFSRHTKRSPFNWVDDDEF